MCKLKTRKQQHNINAVENDGTKKEILWKIKLNIKPRQFSCGKIKRVCRETQRRGAGLPRDDRAVDCDCRADRQGYVRRAAGGQGGHVGVAGGRRVAAHNNNNWQEVCIFR